MTRDEIIKVALIEAIDARKDIIIYNYRHPGIHDPKDVEKYILEMADMDKILKGLG
jgi:hypothetical protein